jgi:YVTN family beta-propeller protein
MKSIIKGSKTLPITQVGKVRWHGWPHTPALQKSSKNARLYRFSLRANYVSVIDTSSNTVVAKVPVGAFPVDVAVTPNGAFAYVTNQNDNTL